MSTTSGQTTTAQAGTGHTGSDRPRTDADRYAEPDWFTRRIFNPMVAGLTRLGVSFWGSRVLGVQGRSSGLWREVPVNLLTVDGVDYLVAPRGTTQWVRNLRVSGHGRLRLGRRIETFTATELADQDKPPVLRRYLERWAWEVKVFFDGVDATSTDAQLVEAGPNHPVFRIERT